MELKENQAFCNGMPVWVGHTSGGWGNGPYSRKFFAGEVCPATTIISNTGLDPVVLKWRAATQKEWAALSEFQKWYVETH